MTTPREDDWEDVPDAAGLPDDVRNGEIIEPEVPAPIAPFDPADETDPGLDDPEGDN